MLQYFVTKIIGAFRQKGYDKRTKFEELTEEERREKLTGALISMSKGKLAVNVAKKIAKNIDVNKKYRITFYDSSQEIGDELMLCDENTVIDAFGERGCKDTAEILLGEVEWGCYYNKEFMKSDGKVRYDEESGKNENLPDFDIHRKLAVTIETEVWDSISGDEKPYVTNRLLVYIPGANPFVMEPEYKEISGIMKKTNSYRELVLIQKRFKLIKGIIRKTRGDLTAAEIETIIQNIDIERKYKISIYESEVEISEKLKLKKSKEETNFMGERVTDEEGEVLLGKVEFGLQYLHESRWNDGEIHFQEDDNKDCVFESSEKFACVITSEYWDTLGGDAKIENVNDLVIFIPDCQFEKDPIIMGIIKKYKI